jgi:hypothetical protein
LKIKIEIDFFTEEEKPVILNIYKDTLYGLEHVFNLEFMYITDMTNFIGGYLIALNSKLDNIEQTIDTNSTN